jgi:hypothetical protein
VRRRRRTASGVSRRRQRPLPMAGHRLIDLQFKQDVGVRTKFGGSITAAGLADEPVVADWPRRSRSYEMPPPLPQCRSVACCHFCDMRTDSENVRLTAKTGSERRIVKVKFLTQSGNWPATLTLYFPGLRQGVGGNIFLRLGGPC